MPRLIKIGTRASPMAVHQAEQVTVDLHAHDPDVSVELVKITTSGDMWLGDLSKLGGKGVFFSLDGSQWHDAHEWGPADDPAALGISVGAALLRKGARNLIDP